MQIVCPKCTKKFEVNDDLIPSEGRLVQCGSCNHKWFYNKIKTSSEILIEESPKEQVNKVEKKIIKKKKLPKISDDTNQFNEEKIKENKQTIVKKNTNKFKIFLVIIISFVALVILVDTFKIQISKTFPEIEAILNSLYETLTDIKLFFKDLIK
tara:strand:+ start:5453 stop:5914 length:462 start_codon:yes stop_codon:yes gene_type:complete